MGKVLVVTGSKTFVANAELPADSPEGKKPLILTDLYEMLTVIGNTPDGAIQVKVIGIEIGIAPLEAFPSQIALSPKSPYYIEHARLTSRIIPPASDRSRRS